MHSTYHQCLVDHGYKPVDSCLCHQKLYHCHRRSRIHPLARNKTTVQLLRRHWVGYVLNFAFLTKTGINNWIKHCLTSGFDPSTHSRPQSPRSFFVSTKNRDLWEGPARKVQRRRPVVHGLPATLGMFRVNSKKSNWLRKRNDCFAHAPKIGPSQRSRFLGRAKEAGPLRTRMLSALETLPYLPSWLTDEFGDRTGLGTKISLSSSLLEALNLDCSLLLLMSRTNRPRISSMNRPPISRLNSKNRGCVYMWKDIQSAVFHSLLLNSLIIHQV